MTETSLNTRRTIPALAFALLFGLLALWGFHALVTQPPPVAGRALAARTVTAPSAPGSTAPPAESPTALAELTVPAPSQPPRQTASLPSASPLADALATGVDSFAVWESNRSGWWRIWKKGFADGEAPVQITPDESGRQHCCPHLSPDGGRMVYLSLPRGQETYPRSGAAGPLHLLNLATGEDRVIVRQARTYFEHRAAIWRGEDELIFIDGEGRSAILDLVTGETRLLTRQGLPASGWLIDPTLRHATGGSPTFSRYEAVEGRVVEERTFGGCQPYFTHDGRWGFWVAGAGGPLRRLDLQNRRFDTLLDKNDSRLPQGQGYFYFPMFSRDRSLLALAASSGEHDHQRANYDVFVFATDPQTLEVLTDAQRLTSDPATDRFPDVHAAPLALGRHAGEAPLTVDFALSGEGWRWDFGDGTSGGEGRHVYRRPGSYRVTARRGADLRRGFVRVRPAEPPRVLQVVSERADALRLDFDEPVDASGLRLELESGTEIRRRRLSDDGRQLWIELAAGLRRADVLTLTGLRDRAAVVNELPPTRLEIRPPSWPSDRQGIVLYWRDGQSRNPVTARDGERWITRFEPQGRVWLDRHGAMVLRGGHFLADMPTMEGLLEGCRASNEISLELWITPRRESAHTAPIFTFSSGETSRNFTLAQRGRELIFRLRTPTGGHNADPEIVLGELPFDRPSHVVISYEPARLVFFLDGRPQLESDALQGGFFHWTPRPLLVGNEWQSERAWIGELEGLVVYDRFVEAEEARRNFERYRARVRARPAVERLVVEAVFRRRAPIPTLEEISPYREALAVFEYEVDHVLEGSAPASTIRVVHRVLLGGERLPVIDRSPGRSYRLELEPFAARTDLESLFLSKLGEESAPLYVSDAID